MQILNEVISVQIQTTKQVNLGAEDQFGDGNKKAAIWIFFLNVYMTVFPVLNKTFLTLNKGKL